MQDYLPSLVAFFGMPIWAILLGYAYRWWKARQGRASAREKQAAAQEHDRLLKRAEAEITFERLALDTTVKYLAERDQDNLSLRQRLAEMEAAHREEKAAMERKLLEAEARARSALEAKIRADAEVNGLRMDMATTTDALLRQLRDASDEIKRLRTIIEAGGGPV